MKGKEKLKANEQKIKQKTAADLAWDEFAKTGAVNCYLLYKQLAEK